MAFREMESIFGIEKKINNNFTWTNGVDYSQNISRTHDYELEH